MPEYQPKARTKTRDPIARAYLECAEWCGILTLDNDGPEDAQEALELAVSPTWTPESERHAEAIAEDFRAAFPARQWGLVDEGDQARIGQDIWLTQNRHGAGFWDGRWPDRFGKAATDWAHGHGSAVVIFDPETETLSIING